MSHSSRKSILCPNCRKLIGIDEPICPYCGTRKPGARWKNLLYFRGLDEPVRLIIIANAAMYFVSILFNPSRAGFGLNPLSLFAPDSQSLLLLGATGTVPIDQLDRWWTLISANYLHGNLLHIFFNMVALRQLGHLMVQLYGVYRLILLYTLSGIAGFLVSYMAGVTFTIGASASVCGLIGACLYYGKSRGGVFGQALLKQIGGWAAAIFVFGFLVPGINNWGHGGGILAGAVLGFLLGYEERRRETLWQKMLALGCIALTIGVLVYAVASALYYRTLG
ncbi:MAG: rhomboid family intramembrane serine protease [Deltaproteobacteria bacterium]|nr:rhomboid family intramembrane serine protease [Deltaproteobacteria bacterium]MBW1993534.1 rhomboid family intramembrane serine protease [Deltaproteobacteria bacterium]MBW2151670.1 rhomboid family intramembrane serine protease [Deltaproteobacteria bacterium]